MRNATATATTRRATTRIAISVLIALAALLSLVEVVPAQTMVDYDLDNDGYIDVSTHAQLNAIRWDLDADGDPVSGNATAYGNAFPNRITTSTGRMGCPATGGCTGYELLDNIDLDTDGDGSADSGDAYWNSGNGWDPIGTWHSTNTAVRFNGDFKGNGYIVENLFISRSSTDRVGLFGVTHSTSRIESLGVTDANVTGQQYTGILVAVNYGEVVACYTTGAVTGSSSVGGLVGDHFGTITTTYSTASVSGTRTLGGLIGYRSTGGTTANSYSTGAVGSGSGTGGFQGDYVSAHGVTASYYDNQTSGKTTSNGGSGQSTSALRGPTGYTGIYSAWDANIDGVTGNDDPWDFGTGSQYPALKYGGHSRVAQGRPAIDYDIDNDNYIDISGHAQLNAVRYDLNGDGNPSDGTAEWRVAFPSAAADVGCAATCTGYELTGNIDIDTNGDGLHSSADAYWNSGAGWLPIGTGGGSLAFSGDFKGNGFTIDNLFVSRATLEVGLFGSAHTASRIESVGITTASVTTTNSSGYAGALVGALRGTVVACWSTGSITSTRVVGGLVGWSNNANAITTSYSRASVTGTGTGTSSDHVGGLIGACQGCGVTNSYATGLVTRAATSTATTVGGLMGSAGTSAGTASYYDTQTTGCVSGGTAGCTTSAGGSGVTGQTTSALQTPVGYTGIYSTWNVNLDGVTGNDDPWDFGTASRYPTLKYGKPTDYDLDNNGYIDVRNLAQFNAIRHDLDANGDPASGGATAYATAFPNSSIFAASRMGCPSGTCTGYELLADLNFDSDNDGDVDANDHGGAYWDSGAGWTPIGTSASRYTGDFSGNGFTIQNLFISRSSVDYQGLFGATASTARIETLGVTNANITANDYVGVLAGHINGEVVGCFTTGAITAGNFVGGLVGYMGAAGATPSIHSSYSYASVTANFNKGGLVGRINLGSITNSYSTGSVPGTLSVGGLVGVITGGNAASISVTNSYWDTQTSGQGSSIRGTGQTTTALKTPTGYTGIYSTWNANIDGNTGNDNPWDFGTASQYPVLRYSGHVLSKQGRGDYDADNDGLIDIANLAQLNVIRHDLNGDGAPSAGAGATAYNAAFPGRDTRSGSLMGCLGACAGYELVASLDFDENGDGSITQTGDPTYWDSGSGWAPISTYTSTFKGNGHTINNLFISRASISNVGLFGTTSGARIETLGVTNANVRGSDDTGILIGHMNQGDIVACYTTGKAQGGAQTGGLVGYSGFNGGAINSSYSTAYVIGSNYVGGLVGFGTNGSITNSYSTGRVAPATNSGGFLGGSGAAHTQSNNYWDTSTSGRSGGIGWVATAGALPGSSGGVTGKTTRELQTVIEYTGIYANWNNNLDGQSGNDDPWAFGNNMQYPMLDYQGMSTVPQGGQAMGIPDNWNAPVTGERVAVCLTPAEFPNRARVAGQTYYVGWIWEKSTNGDTWAAIPGVGTPPGAPAYESPPTYEYSPTSADVGSYLRAKMTLTDGSVAYTRVLGGRVSATTTATAGDEIPFVSGHAAPQVGTQIVASNPLPAGAVDARVGWQRCPSTTTAPHSDCTAILAIPGYWWTSYTPTAADVGSYLRMYAYYETSDGTWTRRVTPITSAVVAAQ